MRKDFDCLRFYVQDLSGEQLHSQRDSPGYNCISVVKYKMEDPLPNFSFPAQVYIKLLSSYHPVATLSHVQLGYGALGDFSGSSARTAKHGIFPSLVKLGRNVVLDVLGNKETLLDSARQRTMEAMRNVSSRTEKGQEKCRGKHHARKHRKRQSKRTKKVPKSCKVRRQAKKSKLSTKRPKRKRVKRLKKHHLPHLNLLN